MTSMGQFKLMHVVPVCKKELCLCVVLVTVLLHQQHCQFVDQHDQQLQVCCSAFIFYAVAKCNQKISTQNRNAEQKMQVKNNHYLLHASGFCNVKSVV